MTIMELCEYLQISRMHAYKFLKENNIAFTKAGKGYKISKKSLAKRLQIEV